jgi:hypothetical protein
MNRLVRGSVILAAAAVSWACGGLDTDGIDETVELVADPGVVYVANTDSQAVFVEALNNLGQQLEGDFTVTNVGPGINVNYDTTFAPRPDVENLPTRVRYFVRASDPTSFVNSSFEVTANGVSVTIPVRITPANLTLDFSNPNPVLGETVTLTAPANLRFTPASTIVFGTGTTALSALVTGLSADSTQISFLLPPNINAQVAAVTNIVVTYLPGQLFTLNTTGVATTPVVDSLPATISDPTPNIGDTLTVTVSAPYKFITGSTVAFGGKPAIILSVSGDSSSATFIPYPGASGATSLVLGGLGPQPLPALPTTATMTMATELPGTDAIATAPVITIPAAGLTTTIVDAGAFSAGPPVCTNSLGGPCRVYQFTVGASTTLTFNMTWEPGTDLGLYFSTTGSNLVVTFGCDAKGVAGTPPGQPETCTGTFAAGTYYMVNDSFSPFYNAPNNVDPTYVRIDITQ